MDDVLQEEQANLLGELAMLRNHAHPHLVEFIGTALAMERGVDTVSNVPYCTVLWQVLRS